MRTGIVLAGGRSARFGADKLTEPIDGQPLLDRAIAVVAAVTDEVIVAGRTIAAASQPIRGVPDVEPYGGPLAGLRGALREAHGIAAVVVGGDMPDLVADVLRAMVERLEADRSIDAAILGRPGAGRTPDGPRPVLPLVLRVEPAAAAADTALGEGQRSLHALLDHLAWSELPAAAWLPLDPEARTLLDVDTPADMGRIRAAEGR
jgi:molybdenum cofactor guanylyltransferase